MSSSRDQRARLFPLPAPQTDFLIIGSGVAGLRSAIELAEHGQVTVLNKGISKESNSEYAQGGIAVALDESDAPDSHYEDTIQAGKGLCRKEMVRLLVEEGPERIRELIAWGTRFDREGGKFAFAREAAHSRNRILRARGDATGEEIVRALMEKAASYPNITTLKQRFTVDLIIVDGICRGALVLDETEGRLWVHTARAVILTTGGVGHLYARTSNPSVSTGDGVAMAWRAGAVLEDMEFIQFHPTSLYLPSAPQFLLSEAMRGEGAILRNSHGEAFMKRYHPDAELAPRDTVSRAIWSEMQTTGSKHVVLDATHLDGEFVKKRFPRIYATCLEYNVDITEEPIPVAPSAHFIMGGVKTNADGATTVPGLLAAGEVACVGVHGANRLASNSLLEGLVFGRRAALAAVRFGSPPIPADEVCTSLRPENQHGFKDSPRVDITKMRNSFRRLMWEKVGIVRTRASLESAVRTIAEWDASLPDSPLDRERHELKNMFSVGRLIAASALARKESVGAHFRSDYPGTDFPASSAKHVLIQSESLSVVTD